MCCGCCLHGASEIFDEMIVYVSLFVLIAWAVNSGVPDSRKYIQIHSTFLGSSRKQSTYRC